jgi:hypothetical protein
LLKQIQQQTRRGAGTLSSCQQDVSVTIPFHTVKELETKFNRFFMVEDLAISLPAIISKSQGDLQGNALLFERVIGLRLILI